MPAYGKKASAKVGQALHELKTGELRSGTSGQKVTSRKQAIAIGLSEARREGGKVPPEPKGQRAGKKTAAKKTAEVDKPKRGLFGFGGIAAGAAEIAKILFFIFVILAAVSFVLSLLRKG